ncbi:hypothetical protein QE250_15340 [Chromatiaceae bacterium AAb-1]|nr:hypothetical protein [Chromatiaceae bacterium AAb-1]
MFGIISTTPLYLGNFAFCITPKAAAPLFGVGWLCLLATHTELARLAALAELAELNNSTNVQFKT